MSHQCTLPDLRKPLSLATCECGRRYIRKHYISHAVDGATGDYVANPEWVRLRWWQRA